MEENLKNVEQVLLRLKQYDVKVKKKFFLLGQQINWAIE